MRFLLILLLSSAPLLPVFSQSAGDYLFQKKSATGPLAAAWITPGGPPSIFGIASGGTLSSFTLGSGLSLSGSTLSSTGGAWGSITGTLAAQTDLTAALSAKLAAATAASTYAPLASPTFTGSVIVPALEYTDSSTKAASTNFVRTWTGILIAEIDAKLSSADAASTFQPLSATLTTLSSATATGLALMDDASASAQRTTLGLGTLATQNHSNVVISGGSITGVPSLDLDNLAISPTTGDAEIQFSAGGGTASLFYGGANSPTYYLRDFADGGTLISDGDVGTVTNTMLAGSIALSKLAVTGTASSTTYLRGDGTWQTISLSGYQTTAGTLGIAGFSAITGALADANIASSATWNAKASLAGNVFTGAQVIGSLGTNSPTPTTAQTIINTTAATVGVQSASPSTIWTGAGWKTTATAGSQPVAFRAYVLPVQGSSAPTGTFVLGSDINNTGTFSDCVTFSENKGAAGSSTTNFYGTSVAWNVSNVGLTIFNGNGTSGTQIGGSSYLPGITLGSAGVFGISSGSPSAGYDVVISRDAAARLQLGADHATVATPQVIKGHDVTTGSGGPIELRGGNGSTAGGAVTLSTSTTTTPTVRVTVKASGVVNLSNVPTSSAGLSSGDIYQAAGALMIVP